ncbi:MAG: hypothetical protein KJ927_00950 [Candidatus Eisenbacteria bacterium]|nr:hypothetical protein [Candidatus Eisenbacteria bacterium]MBU1947263.1 hypothetical protein [Candidatus Eisenbacteria bacterium]
MMKTILSYEKGHLIMAAVRILSHKNQKAPTAGDLVELTDIPVELVTMLLHELSEREILQPIESPFDVRYEIGDYLKLEELQKEDESPKLREEVDKFQEKFRERQEAMEQLFGDPEREKTRQKKLSKLEEELRNFKKEGRAPHPFAEDDY